MNPWGWRREVPIGRKKPATPWDYPTLGRRSRKRNKYSNNLILHNFFLIFFIV
jgi:large subunit ribosomal protein L2